jgi:hypothetical protein
MKRDDGPRSRAASVAPHCSARPSASPSSSSAQHRAQGAQPLPVKPCGRRPVPRRLLGGERALGRERRRPQAAVVDARGEAEEHGPPRPIGRGDFAVASESAAAYAHAARRAELGPASAGEARRLCSRPETGGESHSRRSRPGKSAARQELASIAIPASVDFIGELCFGWRTSRWARSFEGSPFTET